MWVEGKDDLYAITRVSIPVRALFYLAICFFLLWFPAPVRSAFIYFQF
jgi:hypothetical protein